MATKAIAVSVWFAIVPVPDFVRIAIVPGRPLVASSTEVFVVFLAGVMVVLIIGSYGRICGRFQKKFLWSKFESLYRRLNATPIDVENSLQITKSNALVAEFLVKMGLGHWGDAYRSLQLLETCVPTMCGSTMARARSASQ